MGAQLVMAAYTYWSELPHPPFRLLVRLAVTAKDSDPEPRAWIGREEIARSLGLEPTPGNFRNVRRWLRVLTEAGAIECVETGGFNRRSTYVIHRRPHVELVHNRAEKAIRDANKGGRSDPPVGGRSDPPEEPLEEPMKEYGKENHVAFTNSRY